jgi:hypothetical protein
MGTALHVAAATGKVKAANCLIQSGIDVDCQDEVMMFSVNILEGRCSFTGCVGQHCGNTALHIACRNGHNAIAMTLVVAEADYSIKNKVSKHHEFNIGCCLRYFVFRPASCPLIWK